MKTSNHNTEQSARGYLMYQLARRGYNVQFTDSRFPGEDLMVSSPSGKHFGIDVKGMRTKNFWLLKEPTANPELFYAFVYVPEVGYPRVFIMTSEVALKFWQEVKEDNYARNLVNTKKKSPFVPGINWTTPHQYEDRYDLLFT